jgi:hypothetical protein
MNARRTTAAAAVVLLWVAFAYDVSRPADRDAYRRTVTQVTAAAHDAAVTAALTGRQQLKGKLFTAFAASAYDDAGRAVAGAQKKLAAQPPPDDSSARLRDRLAPLVQNTVEAIGDAATADSRRRLRAAVADLEAVTADLDDLRNELEKA